MCDKMSNINKAYLPFPNSKSKFINRFFSIKNRKGEKNIIKITGYRFNKHSGMLISCYIFKPLKISFFDNEIDETVKELEIGLITLKYLKRDFIEETDLQKLLAEIL